MDLTQTRNAKRYWSEGSLEDSRRPAGVIIKGENHCSRNLHSAYNEHFA